MFTTTHYSKDPLLGQALYIRLIPSIRAYKLESMNDLEMVLSYSLKPVDFTTAYQKAVDRGKGRFVGELNREVSEFLIGFDEIRQGLRSPKRVGILHHSSSRYIGGM